MNMRSRSIIGILFLASLALPAAAQVDDLAAAFDRGGLVVQIGWDRGTFDAAMTSLGKGLVQVLDRDEAKVAAAREALRAAKVYGAFSAIHLESRKLPYVTGLVNAVIVNDSAAVEPAELQRVLAPGGVLLTRSGQAWKATTKPRPANIDDWTHALYDPSNNAVSKDAVVAPPAHLQWVVGPDNERSHDHLASLSTAVSCGGRLFYVVDEAPVLAVKLPFQWNLVARDAFSGVLLWKRQAKDWSGPRGPRDVTDDLLRKLVAVDDRVYVSLGKDQPVCALDAATGKTLLTYEGTQGAAEILCDGRRLYVMTKDAAVEAAAAVAKRRGEKLALKRAIVVLDAASGKLLWKKSDADTADLMSQTLAAAGGAVFYQNGFEVLCLGAADGKLRWRAARPANHSIMTVPTLVVSGDLVLSADNVEKGREKLADPAPGMTDEPKKAPMPSELIVYSARDGKTLWRCPYGAVFFSHTDVFVTAAGLWTGNVWGCMSQGYTELRNPATGEIIKRRPADQAVYGIGCPHHRCYKDRATQRYILMGRSGVEFFDSASGQIVPNHWTRGTCQYGVLPANGLLYVPPHPCACYVEAMVTGFNAMAPRLAGEPIVPAYDAGERALKGPAFESPAGAAAAADDWPTYRHDNARSGAASTVVPADARQQWKRTLGGRLSAPTIAAGKVFVAAIDAHAVHALDAADGKSLWTFTPGARVDSPPTYHVGRVFFGCADGWVYCLTAADGKLIWRFKAAPQDRMIAAYDQIESAWPVHGSVLVQDGMVHFAAGRSSYLDGGIYYYRLDERSGRQVSMIRIDSRDPKTGYQDPRAVAHVGFDMKGALPDVLSARDGLVYMRHTGFDARGEVTTKTAPHLFKPAGFLDGSWFHRTYMIIGTRMSSGFVQWAEAANYGHAGEILTVTDKAIYGFARNAYSANGAHVGQGTTRYRLFAAAVKLKDKHVVENIREPKVGDGPQEILWSKEVPLIARAMAAAGGVIWIAGPVGDADLSDGEEAEAALEGRGAGLLWAVSARDGAKLAQSPLSTAPQYDAMAAAAGKLVLCLMDGTVVCYGR
ncbi:MAG: PQQ-binding-like beta-propeller repeat protein [Planctomycetaceae bacterium]